MPGDPLRTRRTAFRRRRRLPGHRGRDRPPRPWSNRSKPRPGTWRPARGRAGHGAVPGPALSYGELTWGGIIMRRVLLVSTAVLGLTSLPVLAQQAEPVQPAVPGTGAAPAEAPAPSAGTTAGAPAPKPIPEQAEHQVRAQSLLGVDVSNGQDTIGEVSDLVVTDDGRVEAIVVGVGGFLGIGEKPVALAWDSIKLTEQDGSRVILVSATREQLEGMPTYKTLEDKQAEADAAAAQQQVQQQQSVMPGVGVAPPAPAPAPAPQPGNQ